MASRIWAQISSVKCIKNTNIRCTPKSESQPNFSLSSSQDTCSSFNSKYTDEGNLGRFFTKTPPPIKNPHPELRDSVVHRIKYGTKLVALEARSHNRQNSSPSYHLMTGTDPRQAEEKIRAIRKANDRMNRTARLQPQSLVPFCSKNAPTFDREDQRPLKFKIRPVKRYQAIYFAKAEQPNDNVSSPECGAGITEETKLSDEIITSSAKTFGTPLQRNRVGYNFTQYKQGIRKYSSCKTPGIKPDPKEKNYLKDEPYKHPRTEHWNKCECCPEMLPCDETICYNEYRFPCPPAEPPDTCPIDCLPPIETPPPPVLPLQRLPKNVQLHKTPECIQKCPEEIKPCVTRKVLPPLPCPPCPCIEPFVPQKCPPLKPCNKQVYQCQPCPPPIPKDCCVDCIIPPKCLPPIIPGDCECVEHIIHDVPPLPRLKLDPIQEVQECKPPCNGKPGPVLRCITPKKLPPIKSDCYCVEPPPLKHVKLVRLPKLCACPPPPDQKCPPEPCPLKADEACHWEYPVKKLKNFWCPDCRIPTKKYKWCDIHTRGQKVQKRNISTYSRCNRRRPRNSKVVNNDNIQIRKFSMPPKVAVCTQETNHLNPFQYGTKTLTVMGLTSVRLYKQEELLKILRSKCRKTDCPTFKDPCCEDRARMSCDLHFEPTCCTPRKSPYPSFSECCEFHQLLTCECKHPLPHLQPGAPVLNNTDKILPPVMPKHKIIDPVPEERCVLNDLCRPYGHTYNCYNFYHGEVVPLRQYECISPHRLPCCERDQICDFAKRPEGVTCEGVKKRREFYRCECNCPPQKNPCDKPKRHELKTLYSKIRNRRPGIRDYSTITKGQSRRQYGTQAPKTGKSSGRPCCKDGREKCGNRFQCVRLPEPLKKLASQEGACDEITDVLSQRLAEMRKRSMACEKDGKRKLLKKQAECAAKSIGMRLVPDHDKDCKHAKPCEIVGGCDPSCAPAERKRPKNVCSHCIPRFDVEQCTGQVHTCPKCCMPYRTSGPECRAKQPGWCKMPIPVCNSDCIRVRCSCNEHEFQPCCVTEAPYPAFSDCHPPFKRFVACEHEWRDEKAEKASQVISKMVKGYSLAATSKRNFSTSSVFRPIFLEKILSYLEDKKKSKGPHEPVKCDCPNCCSLRGDVGQTDFKADLRETANSHVTNTPEDIFKEVDKDNLISLASQDTTNYDKLKTFLYNKAMKTETLSPNGPVDGFKHFEKVAEDVEQKDFAADQVNDKTGDEIQNDFVSEVREDDTDSEPIVITGTSDLLYLMAGENKVINLRPEIRSAHKTNVLASPVCTHILLDSGELLLEHEFNMMNAIAPMKNRKYLPFGLSHEEYQNLERKSLETLQEAIQDKTPKA